ncbi:MAG TPA: hypothetical protein VGN04_02215 [Herbaspirillum sp.]|jgi:hypothetical protein
MHKAALLMSLGLIINSSAAFAAAPILQLKARDGALPRAIDAYSPRLPSDAIAQSTRTAYEPMPASGARLSNAVYNPASRGAARLMPAMATYDDGADSVGAMRPVGMTADGIDAADAGLDGAGILPAQARPAVLGAPSKDSLFYFLKNFKARPVQQPAHWTMFLVGLCFVLYQIRRRPMRAAIGFNAAARLIGGGNERSMGPGSNMGGMGNAVSA